jgi:outer membrane protein assembly factor BamE (lipoprotein component of BamABCDE complex)
VVQAQIQEYPDLGYAAIIRSSACLAGLYNGRVDARMTAQQLSLILLCCTLTSGRAFSGNETAGPGQTDAGQKVKANKTTASSLAEKFKKIKEGMTEQQVIGLMGDPQHTEGNTWTYFLRRAPEAGEQLMLYHIVFRNHIVAQKQMVGGPDATGPAPKTH